jgi:hypothetical protein
MSSVVASGSSAREAVSFILGEKNFAEILNQYDSSHFSLRKIPRFLAPN